MADIVIFDAATGETVERAFTPAEAAQRAADEAAAVAAAEAAATEQAAKTAARDALLKRLGLTSEEAALLLDGS